MYNLSLTACSFHLKVKNSKSKEKIFPLNRTIAITHEEGEPLSFENAKELFYLFFRSHGDMIDDEAKKMTFLNIPFEKTIETGQVGHFHRADCSVVPPRLVTISGAVVY